MASIVRARVHSPARRHRLQQQQLVCKVLCGAICAPAPYPPTLLCCKTNVPLVRESQPGQRTLRTAGLAPRTGSGHGEGRCALVDPGQRVIYDKSLFVLLLADKALVWG